MVRCHEIAQCLQHRRRACGHEPRGNNGFHALVAFHMCCQALYVSDSRLGAVRQRLRAVSVHAYQTDIRTHPRLVEQVRQPAGSVCVGSSKDRSPHRAVQPQVVHKTAIHIIGISKVGIALFLREGVGIEPRQQLHIHCNPHVAVLRRMHMQVVHRGDQQGIPKVAHLRACILRGQGLEHSFYCSIVRHRDIAPLQDRERLGSRSE